MEKFVIVYSSIKGGRVTQVYHEDSWRRLQHLDFDRLTLFDTRNAAKDYIGDFRRGSKSRMRVMSVEGLKRRLIKEALR